MADLEALYRDECPGLVRLARLLLGTVTGGEDLVQDVFVRLAARPSGVDDLENPRAYLRTAVVNACRSEQRHQGVVRRHDPRPPQPDVPAYLGEFADALATLPERQRAAIVLRHHLRPARRGDRSSARVPAVDRSFPGEEGSGVAEGGDRAVSPIEQKVTVLLAELAGFAPVEARRRRPDADRHVPERRSPPRLPRRFETKDLTMPMNQYVKEAFNVPNTYPAWP